MGLLDLGGGLGHGGGVGGPPRKAGMAAGGTRAARSGWVPRLEMVILLRVRSSSTACHATCRHVTCRHVTCPWARGPESARGPVAWTNHARLHLVCGVDQDVDSREGDADVDSNTPASNPPPPPPSSVVEITLGLEGRSSGAG
jgi:hypothetical protein